MERRKIHRRSIVVDVYDEGDGTISIEGHLTDTQPPESGYMQMHFRPDDPRPAGVQHDLGAKLIVDRTTSEIVATDGEFGGPPFRACAAVVGWLQRLVGVRIGPGYHKKQQELLGGENGCSHMGTLLTVMANTRTVAGSYYLRREDYMTAAGAAGEDAQERARRMGPNCHMFRPGGPIDQARETQGIRPSPEYDV